MPRRFRRRRFRRRGRKLFRVNKRASNSFAKGVKRVIYRTSETKVCYYDFGGAANTAANLTNNGVTYYGMPFIPQGGANNQRIGNSIHARWLHISFFLKHTSATADTVADHAVFLVWPKQWSSDDATAAITPTAFPVYSMPDKEEWIWLRVKRFTTSNEDAVASHYPGTRSTVRINMWVKLMRKMLYNNDTAGLPMKSFYLVFSNRVSTGNAVNMTLALTGHVKLSYKDI